MMSRLVVTIETILLLAVMTFTASYEEEDSDNCVLKFVVPKEKMKSSCDMNEKFTQKMISADMQFSRLRQEVTDLKVKLAYAVSHSSDQDVIQEVQTRIGNIETITIPDLTQRISVLEQEMSKSNQRQMLEEETILSLVQPIILKHLSSLKEQVTKELLDSAIFRGLHERNNPSRQSSPEDTAEDADPDEGNDFPPSSSQQKDQYGFPFEGMYTQEDPFVSFNFDQFLGTTQPSTEGQAESSGRSFFQKRSLYSKHKRRRNPASDNELPEQKTQYEAADQGKRLHGNFGKSYPNKPSLSEQMKPILQQQAEKLQALLSTHMGVINERITRVLTVIQGVQTHYDTKLEELESERTRDLEEMNSKIEQLKQDILVETENSKRSLLRDTEFLEFIEAKQSSLENKIISRLPVLTHPLQEELKTLTSKFQNVHRYQTVLESTVQGLRRESRQLIQDIHGNITYLIEQVAELSAPQNDSLDYEITDRDIEIEHTILYMKKMQAEWPEIFANFTRLDTNINLIEKNITKIHGDIRKLPKNYTFLQTQMDRTSEQIRTLRTSVTELTRQSIRRSLDALEWVQFNFVTAEARSGCDGDKYVKKTQFSTGQFVGVSLCSSYRYKIYLSEDIHDPFLEIGDTWRFGEDHCEFVGGTRRHNIRVGPSGNDFQRILGYKRSDWGQTPVIGTLSFFTPTPTWYECGVAIPG